MEGTAKTPRVGYVMSRFPHLPETFILREMSALTDLGWDVRLYPLLRQRDDVVHPEALGWVGRARYVEHATWAVLRANLRQILGSPRTWVSLWLTVLRHQWRDRPSLLRSLALLPGCVHLAERVRRDGIEHVHAHYATYPLLAAWAVRRLTGIPYTVTIHAHDLFVSQSMLAVKLSEAAHVVAISQFNRDFLARHVDPDLPARTSVVHCGVDLTKYGGARADAEPSDTTQLDVLCIGSLQAYKGHTHLIEACRLLRERQVPFRCRIVGAGREEQSLLEQIDHAGLKGYVELMGPRTQEQVADLLAAATCYCQPSVVAPDGQMEGIPVAIMEALASRLPVVATDLSGVPELVQEGRTGWLVPPADPVALAEALEAVQRDPEAARRRAAEGRTLVEQEYDLRVNVARLAELISALTLAAPARTRS